MHKLNDSWMYWLIHWRVQVQAAVASDSWGGVKQSHTNLLHNIHPTLTNTWMFIIYTSLMRCCCSKRENLSYIWSESFKESFTWISAINSSLLIWGFSVTSMPFSCRMVLQHGSTLSLIKTLFTDTGAMTSKSHELIVWTESNFWCCVASFQWGSSLELGAAG